MSEQISKLVAPKNHRRMDAHDPSSNALLAPHIPDRTFLSDSASLHEQSSGAWRQLMASGTAKEKLSAYLSAHPAGATAHELLAVLFNGAGSDPELGSRIIAGLLSHDPNFIFDANSGLWSLNSSLHLRVSLAEAHFVVVDLETAASRPAPGSIIEIGAYRMHGRQILDTFQSLIKPRMPIPRFVAQLTSITNEMVAAAPTIEEVLPRFRVFLGDAVLVAHNAQFDHAFLDFEFRRLFRIGLLNPVLCTLRLARRLLPSMRRRRLELLAEYFGLSTAGRHRGLGDARMAAELLAIFLEMAEQMGVNRLDRLLDQHSRGFSGRRIERHVPPETLAGMPEGPGVYLMRNRQGNLLYVGKANHLRNRLRAYFNNEANLKGKTAELVSHVWHIETRLTRSSLDAALLEARLIRQLKPPYNRMLKSAAPAWFIRIDLNDQFPRLQAVRKLSSRLGVLQLGPFIGLRSIEHSLRTLSKVLGLRQCAGRLQPRPDFSPCIYGQIGYCAAPCNLSVSEAAYRQQVSRAISFLRGYSGLLLGQLVRAREQAGAAMRFEEARRHHQSLQSLTTLAHRTERLSRVITENNLVIVLGDQSSPTIGAQAISQANDSLSNHSRIAYVILSGRLALNRELESAQACSEIARFILDNFDRYKLSPVVRSELEPMTIVARWLKERAPTDGTIIPIHGPAFDPSCLVPLISDL
jgi:DNA polymerase-3 subunit epsilon